MGAVHKPRADHRLRSPGCPLLSGLCVRDRGRHRNPAGTLLVGSRNGQDLTHGPAAMNAGALLSLIATIGSAIAFLLMLEESLALRAGRDPMSNGVRTLVRRIPRSTYALAVIIGMILGHLVGPVGSSPPSFSSPPETAGCGGKRP